MDLKKIIQGNRKQITMLLIILSLISIFLFFNIFDILSNNNWKHDLVILEDFFEEDYSIEKVSKDLSKGNLKEIISKIRPKKINFNITSFKKENLSLNKPLKIEKILYNTQYIEILDEFYFFVIPNQEELKTIKNLKENEYIELTIKEIKITEEDMINLEFSIRDKKEYMTVTEYNEYKESKNKIGFRFMILTFLLYFISIIYTRLVFHYEKGESDYLMQFVFDVFALMLPTMGILAYFLLKTRI